MFASAGLPCHCGRLADNRPHLAPCSVSIIARPREPARLSRLSTAVLSSLRQRCENMFLAAPFPRSFNLELTGPDNTPSTTGVYPDLKICPPPCIEARLAHASHARGRRLSQPSQSFGYPSAPHRALLMMLRRNTRTDFDNGPFNVPRRALPNRACNGINLVRSLGCCETRPSASTTLGGVGYSLRCSPSFCDPYGFCG